MKAIQNSNLLDITEVEPKSEKDLLCLAEIREVLEKYSATDRFGVFLSHKHFPVFEGEALVESCDPKTRTLTIKPVPVEELSGESLMETNWLFEKSNDSEKALVSCEVYCVAKSGGGHHYSHKKER